MKRIKMFLSLTLALVMALSLTVPAFAAGEVSYSQNGFTITFSSIESEELVEGNDGPTTLVTVKVGTVVTISSYKFFSAVDVLHFGSQTIYSPTGYNDENAIDPTDSNTFTLTQPGLWGTESQIALCFKVVGSGGGNTPAQPALPTVEDIPATGTAVATTQTVKLDGKDVSFQTYALMDEKGNPTNYVKIRDLALALNATKAQFEVDWNSQVVINSGKTYAPNGSEGSTPYSGNQAYQAVSSDPVSFNGKEVNLTSFRIIYQDGGYTYYKLHDLGQLLDFNVAWRDGGVVIETDKPYTGQ